MRRLVIIGIDHFHQHGEGLEDLLRHIVAHQNIELVCEEANFSPKRTAAQRVAEASGIRWVQVDMNTEQREKQGISEELERRKYDATGQPTGDGRRYFCRAEGVRESWWLDRIDEQKGEQIAMICGAIHARPLAKRAQIRGYATDLNFFPGQEESNLWCCNFPELVFWLQK